MAKRRPLTAEEKVKRNLRLKAAREKVRTANLFDKFVQRQLERIQARFAKITARLHSEYQRCTLDDMEAQLKLHKHVGTGGYMGPKRPSLAKIENEKEG